MYVHGMLKPQKDGKHNIKALESSLIRSVCFSNETISSSVSKTENDVFIAIVSRCFR